MKELELIVKLMRNVEENEEKDDMQIIKNFKRKELIDVKEDTELNMEFEDLN
jgi:hypothetical protein